MASLQAKIVYQIIKVFFEDKTKLSSDTVYRSRNAKSLLNKLLVIGSSVIPLEQKTIDHVSVKISSEFGSHGKTILYIHGGGFVFKESSLQIDYINRIAKNTQADVVSIDYQLAPEHTFPFQLDEICKIYSWLIKNGKSPKDIYFIGDSAGANLALGILLLLKKKECPFPAGAVLISPPTDGTFSTKSYISNRNSDVMLTHHNMTFFLDSYRGKEAAKNPFISPLFADLKGLPKIQIFVSDNEILFDDAVLLHKKLKEYKVQSELHIGENLWHCYPVFARFVPESKEAVENIIQFISNS